MSKIVHNLSLKDLLSFINEEHFHLSSLHTELANDSEKRAYARVTKLLEESGELAEAVLHNYKLQRKEKDIKDISVGKEIADVIIVVLLLARELDIDVEQALDDKVRILKQRRNTK